MFAARAASGGHEGHKRQENLTETFEALLIFRQQGKISSCGYPLMLLTARGLIVK
jgi:hypothetical protein